MARYGVVGSIAFLAGLGAGIAAAILAAPETDEVQVLDAGVTADDITNAANDGTGDLAVDALKGVTVAGAGAKLYKIRVPNLLVATKVAYWGSKGVNGDQPTEFKLFSDLSTEHLVNIRDKSLKVTDDEKEIINSILENRVAAGLADDSVL